jgi:nucleotidyltransferase substrate binding protein (TIGR01987 family)
MLELSSFEKSVSSMQRALRYFEARMQEEGSVSPEERELLVCGIVQNFEFTYEACWKYMRRWLETNLGTGTTSTATRKQLFRLAFESQLIRDVDAWFRYHELRNLTSHTYDMKIAQEICSEANSFVKDAADLLEAIEKRND